MIKYDFYLSIYLVHFIEYYHCYYSYALGSLSTFEIGIKPILPRHVVSHVPREPSMEHLTFTLFHPRTGVERASRGFTFHDQLHD